MGFVENKWKPLDKSNSTDMCQRFELLKIGVLGHGAAGSRHARLLRELGCHVEVHDPRMAGSFERNGVIGNSDAVIIATPSHHHVDDLASCIASKKPCLVEKPIGLTGTSVAVDQLLGAAKRQGITVAVGFNLRFNNVAQQLREAVERQRPYFASFVCCQATSNREAMINGCINDWACHEIDLAIHILGPLKLRSTYVTPLNADLELRDDFGCVAYIHSDMRSEQHVRYVLLVSDKERIYVDIEAMTPVSDADYKSELVAFLDTIRGIPDHRLASGEDGLAVLQLSEQAHAR